MLCALRYQLQPGTGGELIYALILPFLPGHLYRALCLVSWLFVTSVLSAPELAKVKLTLVLSRSVPQLQFRHSPGAKSCLPQSGKQPRSLQQECSGTFKLN